MNKYVITFSTPYGVEETETTARTEHDARVNFVCEYPEYAPYILRVERIEDMMLNWIENNIQ